MRAIGIGTDLGQQPLAFVPPAGEAPPDSLNQQQPLATFVPRTGEVAAESLSHRRQQQPLTVQRNVRPWAISALVLLATLPFRDSFARLWHLYEAAAISSPLITKAATSGVAYFVGDHIAQRMARTRDRGRLVRASIVGFVSHGPQLHFWTLLMERLPIGILGKVALDQTLFALYINAAFAVLTQALQGQSLRSALMSARASAWPCLKAGWRFWPLAHLLTYSIVPLHLRVLWVDMLEIAWVAILSTCVARNADAHEAPELEAHMELRGSHGGSAESDTLVAATTGAAH